MCLSSWSVTNDDERWFNVSQSLEKPRIVLHVFLPLGVANLDQDDIDKNYNLEARPPGFTVLLRPLNGQLFHKKKVFTF